MKTSLFSPPMEIQRLPMYQPQASQTLVHASDLPHKYAVSKLASQHPQSDSRSPFTPSYPEQASQPRFTHSFGNAGTSRRRSSDSSAGAFGGSQYLSRPRSTTSFSSLYRSAQPVQGASDASLAGLPSSLENARPSWDLSAFLRSEPGSISHDLPYTFPSRQNSQASHSRQEYTQPITSESGI